ncbi:MAG: hypothetical protein AAF065_13325 [Verrucomicrobiota bacterium]
MRRSFEAHIHPNCSQLEKWRYEIAEMRAQNWPYRKILAWLASEESTTVGRETLRQFCLVRGITKGKPKQRPLPTPLKPKKHRNPKKTPVFEYTDDGPIELEDH